MSGDALNKFLDKIAQSKSQNKLQNVLNINPATARHLPELQRDLQKYGNKQLESIVENRHFFDNSWPAFETMVTKYLIFAKDFDPWSLLNSIDLMIEFYHSLSVALNNKQFHRHLFATTYQTTKLLLPLTKFVDCKVMQMENRTNNYPRLSYLSTVMLKVVNNLRSSPGLDELGIKSSRYTISVLMYVCISLCNLYIYIDSPMLCNNVFSNMNILRLDKKLISKSQLIQYRFVLAKFHLCESNYYKAYHHFQWCLLNCHVNTSVSNLVKILKYLIPCGLLVGKVVNIESLTKIVGSDQEGLQLVQLYTPLIKYYKIGDIYGFTQCVHENRTYFIGLSLYIGFIQRVRILIMRNLMVRVYRLKHQLTFSDVRSAIELTLRVKEDSGKQRLQLQQHGLWFYEIADNVDDSLVANVLVTLIDSNLVRAKLTASKNVIVSKKKPFPSVYAIYGIKYSLRGSRESWLE